MDDYLKPKFSKSQINIYQECIEKSYDLCLDFRASKTLITLVEALNLSKDKPIIIVCNKTKLSSLQTEIINFFGCEFPYIIYDYNNKEINTNIKVILTTPEVLTKFYKENKIKARNFLYTTTFGTLIVDQTQNYYNIPTIKCRAIVSLNTETIVINTRSKKKLTKKY